MTHSKIRVGFNVEDICPSSSNKKGSDHVEEKKTTATKNVNDEYEIVLNNNEDEDEDEDDWDDEDEWDDDCYEDYGENDPF